MVFFSSNERKKKWLTADFSVSRRGAMLCVVKSKRKEKHAEALTQDYIITRRSPTLGNTLG